MIANDTFSAVFGAVPNGDAEALAKVAKAAVGARFAIVVNEPGGKKPLCILTARDAKKADQAAQDTARDAGDTNWTRRRHECGTAHAITDPAVAERVVKRLTAARGHVNLGIEVGRSRVLVVDVDTAAEKAAFLTAWSEAVGSDMTGLTPTVLSPGKMLIDAGGETRWVHKDGGHYYFALPDDVDLASLPGTGILTDPAGSWVAIFRDKQVIVPPSVRAEGPYRLAGQVYPPQLWLLDRIRLMAEARVERQRIQRSRIRTGDDPIDTWSRSTPWADLLGPDGWTDTGLLDNCDCPIWTRPGDASTPKSATAHDTGCTGDRYSIEDGHGPIHVWTDNPPDYLRVPGVKTFSKLQYVALRDHAGDGSAAMRALGLAATREPRVFDDLWTGQPGLVDDRPAAAVDGSGVASSDPVGALASPELPYAGLPVEQPSLFEDTSQPAQTAVEAPVDAEVTEDPPEVEDAPQPELQPVVYPPELLSIARSAIDARLPSDLVDKIRYQAEAEWAREEYRRLKNRGQVAEIRSRLRGAVDRLSEVTEDDELDLWRIDELWMQGQIVMLTAQYKAGKTTMVTNIVHSLVDGVPFLGRFETTPVDGSVFIVNAEMTRRQFRRWLFESPISPAGRERVFALHVREAGPSAGDILDPTRRDELVDLLNEVDARVLVMDPLNPLISSAGLDENASTDVASWFTALADIQERTGVSEVFLVHHFGHTGQRGRGSSKFMDAPDALWTYTIEGTDEDETVDDDDDVLGVVQPAAAPRYLAAVGRDVELAKTAVAFDRATRTLTLAHGTSGPTRKAVAEQKRARDMAVLVRRLVLMVADKPGITSNALYSAIGGNKTAYAGARDEAVRTGQIHQVPGPNRSTMCYPGSAGGSGETSETR